MELWIILALVFGLTGLAFYVGYKSKEQSLIMDEIERGNAVLNKAEEIGKEVTNSSSDAVRNELRDKLQK